MPSFSSRSFRYSLFAAVVCLPGCFSDPYYINEQLDVAAEGDDAVDIGPNRPQGGSLGDPAGGGAAVEQDSMATDANGGVESTDESAAASSAPVGPFGGGFQPAPNASTATSVDDAELSEGAAVVDGLVVAGLCWPLCEGPGDLVRDGWSVEAGRMCVIAGKRDATGECSFDPSVAGLTVQDTCYAPCPPGTIDIGSDGLSRSDAGECVVADAPIADGAEPCPLP